MLRRLTRSVGFCLLLCFSAASLADGHWLYKIKKGESFWSIADKHLVDVRYWLQLQELNKVTDPTDLTPGSTIKIPLDWTRIYVAEASVQKVTGKVTMTIAGSEKTKLLKRGMRLSSGDHIETEKGASVSLKFGDGSVLVLREQSELNINRLESYGDEDVFNSQLKLKRGQTENSINPFKKPGSRFEIKTPSATAAVRGTVYRVSAPDQDTTRSEVLEGRVSVVNDHGNAQVEKGFGTIAKRDEAPLEPVVLLAAPDLTDVENLVEHLPLRFTLPEIKNASAYRVRITQDPSFESLVYSGLSSSTTTKIAELADGEYLLSVRGVDENGIEGFDSKHSFVLNAKPEAPFSIQPSHEGVIPIGETTFSWSKTEGIDTYHFQLSQNANFDQIKADIQNNVGESVVLKESLEPGRWFWRVSAVDEVDGEGPFGEVNQVRVMKPGPDAEAAALSDKEIGFRWVAGVEGETFQIQVAEDENFAELIVDERVSEASHSLPRSELSTDLYMRTRVIEADGFEGSWSSIQIVELPNENTAWMAVLPFLLILL